MSDMQLTMNKVFRSRVKQASKKMGLPETELIERAVFTYLDDTGDIASLYKELRAWDAASAQTMKKHEF